MLYDTNSPVFASFLTKSKSQAKATKGGNKSQAPKGPKAKGSDGKYQGE